MNAISDRSYWLAHLKHCTQCPVNPCDRGAELIAAVQATMAPGESWEGVYRPVGHIDGQLALPLEIPRDPAS